MNLDAFVLKKTIAGKVSKQPHTIAAPLQRIFSLHFLFWLGMTCRDFERRLLIRSELFLKNYWQRLMKIILKLTDEIVPRF